MFGKDKLLETGAETGGVIIESGANMRGQRDMRGRYPVTVRVRFDDGSVVEVSRKLHMSCGLHDVGYVLPMRFDASDRSKLEIDEPALKARHEAGVAEAREASIARGEGLANRSTAGGVPGGDAELAELASLERPEPSPADSLDRLAKLADLRDRGVLTQAEFAAEKARILAGG